MIENLKIITILNAKHHFAHVKLLLNKIITYLKYKFINN